MSNKNVTTADSDNQDSFWDWSDPVEDDAFTPKVSAKWVPIKSLKTLCIEVLSKNVDSIYNVHNFPIDLTLSFINDASSTSLYWFERRNSRLKKETDGLWEKHFKKQFPLSKVHLTNEMVRGWRHCYMLEKRKERERTLRFAKKFKESQEASKLKRQIKVENSAPNHLLNLSHSQRIKYEARTLKENPSFEKIKRQTIQQAHRIQNVGRPCQPPPGTRIGISYPLSMPHASPSSSSSMSPPASFPNSAASNSWSMSPQMIQTSSIPGRVREERERHSVSNKRRNQEDLTSNQKDPKRIKKTDFISKG